MASLLKIETLKNDFTIVQEIYAKNVGNFSRKKGTLWQSHDYKGVTWGYNTAY